MNKTTPMMIAGVLLLSVTISFSQTKQAQTKQAQTKQAQTKQAKKDYAPTASPSDALAIASLKIHPDQINVVAGNLGKADSGLRPVFLNHMNLWAQATPGAHQIEWTIQASADDTYDVTAMVRGKGSKLVLSCNEEPLSGVIAKGNGWERVLLGSVSLKSGENQLELDIRATKGFSIDVLELAKPEVKAAQLKDALAMRQHPDWFANAGYGLMFQWTNRATPPAGPIKPWEEKVNDFDLDGFVAMVDESGAAYVLWSVTWGQQYISAPIESLDALIAGRTTKRDLLGEMADALAARDIKLIFYYHYGYDCNHSIDADWMKACGGYKADKTELYKNWMAIISEMSDRYGDKLHGWWFDGGQRYFNCHFDNTPGDQGILSAPFKELTLAAKSGNPDRVVAYNSWIKPRLTEYQDYYGGEGAHVSGELENGIFSAGPQQGLSAHGCFILERRWGHIEKDSIIPKPKFSPEKLTAMIQGAMRKHYPLSINLEMYEDGSVSPKSVVLLQQLKKAIRTK